MAKHMDTVKTTINVDNETLQEFKKIISSRYGTSRKLSTAIEEAMRSYNASWIINTYAEKTGITLGTYPSSREIKNNRPTTTQSAGEEVRAMRNEKASVSRHQQPS